MNDINVFKINKIKKELKELDKAIWSYKSEKTKLNKEISSLEDRKDTIELLIEALRDKVALKIEERIELMPDPVTINEESN